MCPDSSSFQVNHPSDNSNLETLPKTCLGILHLCYLLSVEVGS